MQNKRNSNSKLAVIWLAVVLIFGALLVKQFALSEQSPIETNILKLLPENQQNSLAENAFQQVADSMGSQVVLVISSDSKQDVIRAAQAFEKLLQKFSLFRSVQGQISQDDQSKWAEFYFKYRAQLLTESQADTISTAPDSRVQFVLQSLYNPFLGVTASELSQDPFLLFREYITELSVKSGNFSLSNGFLTAEKNDQYHVLLSAELAGSPYQLSVQKQLPELFVLEKQISEQYNVEPRHTGVVFYADYGTQSAKSEISTIGLGSLLGVIFLVLWVFRSALPLSLALLSISTGLLVALASTIAIFGQVHLFSLVFGASLIGVSIDYAFHFLTDRLAAGNQWNSRKGLQHIFIAITLGLITSLIGYLGLLIAPFPGLQQLALFSAIGLFAAYASVVCWYPLLARSPSQATRTLPGQSILTQWLSLWQRPKLAYGLPCAITLLSLIGLSQIHYDDDIRQLQAMPKHLQDQEQVIADLAGINNSQQMLLVTAESPESLLNKLSQASVELDILTKQQVISGHQSIDQYLPSQSQQAKHYQLIEQLYEQKGATLQSTLGWSNIPDLPAFAPITIDEFLKSPVSKPMRFMWLDVNDHQFSSVVMLKRIQDDAKFQQWLASPKAKDLGIVYLNKAKDISNLFGEYRVKIAELLSLALITIFALLSWRYGWKQSLKMILPSLIAGIAALAITAALGSSLNLFNLLGLILILGIGIDYTLFFSEQNQGQSTLLAITLSAMTTLLSFGLLALSQTHAIHSFGITVLTGIFIAWLLAPMAIQQTIEKDNR
ncbi:hypothetical protein EK599_11500 [Vibrio sp. T187]|uniref:MMPL family transporter n=1 Tax=Vibrio TaxID=662 RepID=UPI0010C99F20|nr:MULTISPECIES: MMPL family transporter [Vibrio]MBW3696319.1 hypothetical protein [Vibrio sp. T187]